MKITTALLLAFLLLGLPAFAERKPKPISDADRVRILKLQMEQLRLLPEVQSLQDRLHILQKEYSRLTAELGKVSAEILEREKLDANKYALDLATMEIAEKPTPPSPATPPANPSKP